MRLILRLYLGIPSCQLLLSQQPLVWKFAEVGRGPCTILRVWLVLIRMSVYPVMCLRSFDHTQLVFYLEDSYEEFHHLAAWAKETNAYIKCQAEHQARRRRRPTQTGEPAPVPFLPPLGEHGRELINQLLNVMTDLGVTREKLANYEAQLVSWAA